MDGLENFLSKGVAIGSFLHVHEAIGDWSPYRHTKIVHIYMGRDTMEDNVFSWIMTGKDETEIL